MFSTTRNKTVLVSAMAVSHVVFALIWTLDVNQLMAMAMLAAIIVNAQYVISYSVDAAHMIGAEVGMTYIEDMLKAKGVDVNEILDN